MSSPNVETNPPISAPDSSLLVRANEGRTLHAFGEVFVVMLDGKQTGEKFTAFLSISPPGGGPGPHYDEREDEWFYIVEGRCFVISLSVIMVFILLWSCAEG